MMKTLSGPGTCGQMCYNDDYFGLSVRIKLTLLRDKLHVPCYTTSVFVSNEYFSMKIFSLI